MSRSSGAVIPAPCRANFCEACGPRKAWKVAVAVDLAAPERLVRFSLVGPDHKTQRSRISRVVYDLHSLGFLWEHWGAVEVNPRGTGFHFHAWQRGDFVPQGILQRVCDRRGMGYPDIRKWRRVGGGSPGAAYGLKASAAYGLKGESVLDLNGGRFGSHTREFFGGPLREKLSEAAAMMLSDRPNSDAGPWVARRVTSG